MLSKKYLLLGLLGLMFIPSSFAIGWKKLGEVSADVSLDRVTINCSEKGTFKSIKFRVEGAPVEFERVLVKYATGATDDLKFSQSLKAGEKSESLDLRGDRRTIREVILYIKSDRSISNDKGKGNGKGQEKRRGRQAKVQVWGYS